MRGYDDTPKAKDIMDNDGSVSIPNYHVVNFLLMDCILLVHIWYKLDRRLM